MEGQTEGQTGDRSAHFPAIERKHGKPIAFWLQELAALGDEAKYAQRIAFLRERHGFSQAHANALVLFARGSTSARRFDDPDAYFRSLGGVKERTARAVFAAITAEFPDLELVIAWNQPMVRRGRDYVFGLSAATNHLLLGPWVTGGLGPFAPMLAGLVVNTKTIRIPVDWEVDAALLHELVRARLAELAGA
jgi:uncharacterized protein YdhG (YjbR/CyaY superfamily)